MLGQPPTTHRDLEYRVAEMDCPQRVRRVLGGLNRAITSMQVARVLVEAGAALVSATSGALVLFSNDRRGLRVAHAVGQMAGPLESTRRIDLTTRFPLADVVRSRQEIWLASREELLEHYPDLGPEAGAGSWAVLPLLVEGVVLGAVGWSLPTRGLRAEERESLRALARAGGAAMYRARLFDTERRGRAEAEIARYSLARQLESAKQERTELIAARVADIKAAELGSRSNALMAEVSATLDVADDATTALARVARLCLQVLGDWCAVDVLDAGGSLQRVAAVHVDAFHDRTLGTADARGHGPQRKLPRSLRDGRPVVSPSLRDKPATPTGLGVRQMRLLRQVGLTRLLVIPMRIRGQTVGTIAFGSTDSTTSYTTADIALAERIGRRCAASIEYTRLHRAAQREMQARDDFVASTSHELRTPLSHIKGFVSTLRTTDTIWDAETRDDFLAEIEHEADRLAKLVENMLDMSRIDSGGVDASVRSATMPSALVTAGIERVGSSLGAHSLEIQVPEDLPPVLVDSSQVERVLANLLDNAAKYSPPGEPIGLVGRLAGDSVNLRVEDRGLGIPPEHLERVFEPFFREPTGGYPAKPGTGLGLAICRSIIRAQGGRIWAEQRAGGGAAFVFTLPVVAGNRRT
jgi:signal transduction histidine kinase